MDSVLLGLIRPVVSAARWARTGHAGPMGKSYTVVRRTSINASVERLQGLIRDFREWPKWSPWEDIDPQMTRHYSGADAGVGAAYAWEGNKKAGKGSMLITRDEPGQVDLDLKFEKPFPAQNRLTFTLRPAGEVTAVEWRMDGELNLFMRVFALIRSMDKLVGPDFERGLAKLKRAAEAG